jgi:YVTN family beta-propeller protein
MIPTHEPGVRPVAARRLGLAALCILAALAAGCGRGSNQAAAPENYRIYATNEHSGNLTVIDGKTFKPVATLPVGKRPRGIRPGPHDKELFIALSGSPIAGPGVDEDKLPPADKAADGIGVYDLATDKITRVITGVSDPEKLAVSKDGKLYISSEDTGMLVIIDIASGKTLAKLPVGEEPEGVDLSPDGRFAYVTSESDNEVSIIDTAAETVVKRIPVGERPRNTAFSPDGIKAYVPGESDGSVTVIDTTRQVALRTVHLRNGDVRPMGIVVSPDGKTVYVTTGRGGTVLSLNAETLAEQKEVAVGKRPWGLAMSPDGKYLFTANGPSNDVSVIDAAAMTVVSKVPAGNGPWGVVVVPTTN